MKKKLPGMNRTKLQTKVHGNSAMMFQGGQSSDEPSSGVQCEAHGAETQNLATLYAHIYVLF